MSTSQDKPRIATHNTSDSVEVDGTHLQGYITHSFGSLIRAFGEPLAGDGYKTKAEWLIQDLDTGVVATIYDYKSGINASQNVEWHVGGYDKDALQLVRACMKYGCER